MAIRMWPLLLALFCFAPQDVAPHVSDHPLTFSLDSDIVHPVRVDERGSFLTFDLTPRTVRKRGISPRHPIPVYYAIKYQGVELTFNLSQNHQLLSPGYVSEWHSGGIREATIHSRPPNFCHMSGEVQNEHRFMGNAAVSICSGLSGVFQLAQEDFLIEPVEPNAPSSGESMPHRIYRRHLEETAADEQTRHKSCGVKDNPNAQSKWDKRRERWEQLQTRKYQTRRIRPRSISKEKWVETLVVADHKMVEYHGRSHVENYVLTIMNMVAGLFHDASIGNRINIVIVRLILLEREEEELKITHHADNTLRSFCKWQKSLNMKDEEHPLHHDVAVLLTRKDICAAMNRPCETLGLSHVSGMCQPHRSCNINEDTGLPTAFTVTHEIGHSFGVQHDGSGNECEPQGKRPHIMSPQLLYDNSPLTWSRCSRDYITRFLDRGWGLCLDDLPSKELLEFPSVPPGVLYDVGHQCRLQYGVASSFCVDIDNVCNTLWCSVGSTCHSKLDAAVDGTTCGENKWCFGGDCVPVGHRPSPVDGLWGSWSSWSPCSRTCGAGIQSAERHCSNPTPRYGGRYCLGERKRYRVCNIVSCPPDTPSFRQMQCSQFDSVPYKGKLHRWSPVPSSINPCELHCRSHKEHFAVRLLDAVIDGTPCYEGNRSRDMCINGICKNIGCDYEIDSNAVEDRCGVCRGDDSTCHTVHKTFEDTDGLGYVDIGLIPPGAREIRIEEVAEAENFLALRSEDPEKYFLNGRWTIQWDGDYQAAGTTFTYTRTGNLENLTAPGPTYEPVWIQLLFQEKNPGIRYQYTVKRDQDSSNEIQPPEFSWRYGSWTECSATCGTGVQRQLVHCVEKTVGLLEERYCDSLSRPDDRQRSCNEEPCPPRWWVGEWQQCSTSCGTNGVQKRTVLCIQRVGLDEQRALQPTECQHLARPEPSIPCNHHLPCPAVWHQGNWSECSVSCGEGVQYREVHCMNKTEGEVCEPSHRPLTNRICTLLPCPLDSFYTPVDWTGSGSSSREIFNDIFPGRPRAPSRNHHPPQDNSISEGDFSSIGEGGQGKGRAFVDDFYYDYNFINFHEDLSYDPLDDNNIDEGGNMEHHGKEHPTQIALADDLGNGVEEEAEENVHSTTTSHFIPTRQVVDVSITDGYVQYSDLPNTSTSLGSIQEDWNRHEQIHDDYINNHYDFLGTTEEPQTTQVSSSVTPHNTFLKIIPGDSLYQTTYNPSEDLTEDSLPHIIRNNLQDVTQEPKSDIPTSLSHPAQDASDGSLPDFPSYLWSNPTADPANFPYSHSIPVSLPDSAHDPSKYPTANPLPAPVKDSSLNPTYTASQNPRQDLQQDHTKRPLYALTLDPFTELYSQPTTSTLLANQMQEESSQIPNFLPSTESKKMAMETTSKSPSNDPMNPFPTALKSSLKPDQYAFTASQVTSLLPTVLTMFPSEPNHNSQKTPDFHSNVIGNSSPHLRAITDGEESTGISEPPVITHTTFVSSSDSNYLSKGYWVVGNWSECSTSCGLGAMWRSVWCSEDGNETCDPATKPAPAHRCFLRPCASWSLGAWGKCSQSCGTGVKVRDVHCVNIRDKRILRPFHCQAVTKPRTQMPCQEQPCMEWNFSPWSECSEECGGGEQERDVTCPKTGSCNENLKPNSRRSCNEHLCTAWSVAPWSQVHIAPVTESRYPSARP
ncbi:A disintegrin and metalloproteinase with thrombospondin motifs 7 isoform X2 [Spea bombifrons]|uniref:A disintegrin and metalloproteinase with thrombospondin motifs 7 isoform X2 n=1 Tax=Spea bombifrons TaxID=233779 RepID=UPI0023494CAF|nr:A disintegrin and metalloproteinase with thrombospondin motifs 7 isoform X2 [Spea bombifrons]